MSRELQNYLQIHVYTITGKNKSIKTAISPEHPYGFYHFT